MALTEQEFMAELLTGYEEHLKAVREGREEPYTYLAAEGVNYNGYLEHRHAWPVTEDGLCAPYSFMAPCCENHDDSYPLEADECPTCQALIRLYEAKKKSRELANLPKSVQELLEEHRRNTRYFLDRDGENPLWLEVTEADFVKAERAAGFRPKPGCGPVATASWSSGGRRGTTVAAPEYLSKLGRYIDLDGILHTSEATK